MKKKVCVSDGAIIIDDCKYQTEECIGGSGTCNLNRIRGIEKRLKDKDSEFTSEELELVGANRLGNCLYIDSKKIRSIYELKDKDKYILRNSFPIV